MQGRWSWGASLVLEPGGRRPRGPGPPPGEGEQRGEGGVEPKRRGPGIGGQGMPGVVRDLDALRRHARQREEERQDLPEAGRAALVVAAAVVVEDQPVAVVAGRGEQP